MGREGGVLLDKGRYKTQEHIGSHLKENILPCPFCQTTKA
jgi:hypothetical protein